MAYVVLTGVQRLAGALTAIQRRQIAATREATSKALHLIERETKVELSTSSHRRGEPTPSAPGEPPSLVSGALRRSNQVEGPEPTGPTGWEGQVGPTIEYGRIQELGGVAGHGVTLPARPYLGPAFDRVLPDIAEIYRSAWAAALRG